MDHFKNKFHLLHKDSYPSHALKNTPFNQWEKKFISIAGHCSIDPNHAEIFYQTSDALKKIGIDVLRGGVWKPRTSPYSFRGSDKSLSILLEAKKRTGLPVLTEVLDMRHLSEVVSAGVDVVQIGTRNSLNYHLLEEVGRHLAPRPQCSVVLKHGLHMGSPQDFLCAAEYIALQGTVNILLCLRGISPMTEGFRFQLDSANVLPLQELTWAPILFDPSHSTGKSQWVCRAAMAATAYGCNGLNIECHSNPAIGLCDDPKQAITPSVLKTLLERCQSIRRLTTYDKIESTAECGAVG